MNIILYILIFCLGLILGIVITKLLGRRNNSSGNIVVTKSEGRTLYSLELNDDPGKIEFKKKVIFKVVPDDESYRR